MANGVSTLVTTAAALAGNCVYCGTKFMVGQDTNGNQTLDTSEVQSTAYVCNGAAGATGATGANGMGGGGWIIAQQVGQHVTSPTLNSERWRYLLDTDQCPDDKKLDRGRIVRRWPPSGGGGGQWWRDIYL